MTDIERKYIDIVNAKANDAETRRLEGVRIEEEVLIPYAKKFLDDISFLNNYGWGFYLDIQPESGCTTFKGQRSIKIRSTARAGFIEFNYYSSTESVHIEESSIINGYAHTIKDAEDFVTELARR